MDAPGLQQKGGTWSPSTARRPFRIPSHLLQRLAVHEISDALSFVPACKNPLGRPRHVDMIVRRPLDLQPAAVELHLGFSLRASRERGGDKRRA